MYGAGENQVLLLELLQLHQKVTFLLPLHLQEAGSTAAIHIIITFHDMPYKKCHRPRTSSCQKNSEVEQNKKQPIQKARPKGALPEAAI